MVREYPGKSVNNGLDYVVKSVRFNKKPFQRYLQYV